MKQENQSMVVPFRLSPGKMRRSAAQYRRHGQVLEALTLLRRAAEQDDTTSGWQQVAAELRQMGCWEASARLLGRVLSREDHAPSAWLDMARCQMALRQNALAADCLYHQLQEDPWSPEADVARMLLAELSTGEEKYESRRTAVLLRRTLEAQAAGNEPLYRRRAERALRICRDQEHMLLTLAMMHTMRQDMAGAARWLARGLKKEPESLPLLCYMGTVLHQMGRPRAARAMLRLAMPHCTDTAMESQFLATAWALEAWPELTEYLKQHLQHTPNSIPLLQSQAMMRYEQGDAEGAQHLWRHILGIDPGDRSAAVCLNCSVEYPGAPLPVLGRIPQPMSTLQEAEVYEAAKQGKPILTHGSRLRQLLEWLVASSDRQEQRTAFRALRIQGDRAGEQRFLREVLTRPDVPQPVIREALLRLAEMEMGAEMTLLAGNRYTTVQCRPAQESPGRSAWHAFLPALLLESRPLRQSADIAQFAAEMWGYMTPAQHQEAAGQGGFL